MADDEPREEYDPSAPTPPARDPPLRETAPQGPYTGSQIATGFAVLVIGLALIFGLGIALA